MTTTFFTGHNNKVAQNKTYVTKNYTGYLPTSSETAVLVMPRFKGGVFMSMVAGGPFCMKKQSFFTGWMFSLAHVILSLMTIKTGF
jgi:hypothetical protein